MLEASLIGKAARKGLVSFQPIQIRDFATDKHASVDDSPFGGGEGMVMKVDVLHAAWKHARGLQGLTEKREASAESGRAITILLSPQGRVFDQDMAKELAGHEKIILVCGHYEGVDERFVELCVDREVSIGDYVLTGGELPALVMADTITRLRPGVVGKEQSVAQDSLENGFLKYAQYTRPRSYEGLDVPEVIMGGNHAAIAKYRRSEMETRTRSKRPDLWAKLGLKPGSQGDKP